MSNTKQLFACLQRNNVLLNPDKSRLFEKQIEIVGHYVSPTGISLAIDSTKHLTNYPAPTSVKALQSFNGLAVWCAKWISNFGSIMAALFKAAKQKTFSWTEACEASFNHIKSVMSSSPD